MEDPLGFFMPKTDKREGRQFFCHVSFKWFSFNFSVAFLWGAKHKVSQGRFQEAVVDSSSKRGLGRLEAVETLHERTRVRCSHNPEVVGSNPSPATMYASLGIATVPGFFRAWDRLVPMDLGQLDLVVSIRIQSFLVRFIRASNGRRSNGHVLSGSRRRRRPVVRGQAWVEPLFL